jgi:hypothetical protein
MTTLGDAVKKVLETRGIELAQDRVEKVLLDADVSSRASRGVPSRLRVRRLRVTGTKYYSETPGRRGAGCRHEDCRHCLGLGAGRRRQRCR